jgi:Tfp pilus assembly major pilin PilA
MRQVMSQRGITLIGFMIVLALAGFAFLIGAKLFPMYTEFMAVKAAMVQVQNTPGSARLSPEQVWKILDRTFYTSYVESVKRTDMQLVRQNGYFLRIAYEVRKPLVYNLDVVGKFEHSVELGRTDAVE